MKSINLMKNIGRFTPPQNCQVRFTLKSSVRFNPPEIAKSDLPSNRLYDLPPPKSPSPIYPQIICKSYRRFEGKSDLVISGGG